MSLCAGPTPVAGRGVGLLLAVIVTGVGLARAQSVSDAEMLSRAYAALAAGKAAEALRLAEQVLAGAPRHHAAATVSVAAASEAGVAAGLDQYERWLAASRHEDAFVLEPVALAALKALSGSRGPAEADARQALRAAQLAGPAGADESQAGQESGRALAAELGKAEGRNTMLLLRALARSGYRAAAPQVLKLLGDPIPDHRAAAAETLAALGATEAIPALRALLQDPASEVRAATAAALHRLGDAAGDALLADLLASDIPDIQLQAAHAMVNDPPSMWAPQIQPLLAAEAPMTRLTAARLLLPVEPEQARQVLTTLLADPNPVVVGEMARVLADAGLADLPTIRQLLRQASPEARLNGARALLRLTGGLP